MQKKYTNCFKRAVSLCSGQFSMLLTGTISKRRPFDPAYELQIGREVNELRAKIDFGDTGLGGYHKVR